jgi:4-amino-4-deoxy-L-arabinose transferase-like glycosyltransferase
MRWLLVVLLVAAGFRLAFAFRAPAFFIGGDSQTYLLPAYDLVTGAGFSPILKRPPLYPLFVAGSFDMFGLDLRGLALLQHIVGLVTVALTYFLGVVVGGRLVGVVAALIVAINGPLIVYERYVMSETLAACLTTAATLALVVGLRGASRGQLLVAGGLLGLAALCRPSTQLLLPLVPVVAWLAVRSLGPALRLSVPVLAAFVIVWLPWSIVTFAQSGSVGGGGLGEALFWRGTRETPIRGEPYLIGRESGRPSEVADPTLQAARRLAYQRALDEELPSDIAAVIRERFGYSEAAADAILRDVALEAFGRQPGRYALTSLGLFARLLVGSEQWLGGQGKTGGVERYANPQDKYADWWPQSIRDLPQPASPAEANEFDRAKAIANVFQPYRLWGVLVPLMAIGGLAALILPGWRPLAVPLVIAIWLLLTTALLSGALPRYRYPVEPLLAVLTASGLAVLIRAPRHAARMITSTTTATPTPTGTNPTATVGR